MLEKELEKIVGAPRSQFMQINITAAICMAVLILGVLAIKYLSPPLFSEFNEWYQTYILDETSTKEVLDGVEIDEV